MPRLTKRFLDNMQAGQSELVIWDDELPGFGIRIKPSGVKSFCVQYRNAGGRSRRVTVGRYGRLTIDEARRMARQLLAEADKGEDPAEQLLEVRRTLSVRDLADRYLSDHAEVKKKSSSVVKDRQWLNRFILPALGTRKISEVVRHDVAALHHSMRDTPYQANRTLEVLRKMFNLAERWGLMPDGSNPCRHVEKFKERKRERFLNGEELARLGAVLGDVETEGQEMASSITAIRLLLFTGCRLGEILGLRWDEVDLEWGVLRLRDSKTGAKVVALGGPALEVLSNVRREEGNQFVCPGSKPGGHLVGIYRSWARIQKRAGLEGVRLHDLRHNFASVGAAAGMGLPIIGALLGHTQASTTQRYAHLANDPLKAAADEISSRIAESLCQPVRQ